MGKSNSKYLTLVFILTAALVGFTMASLLHALSGAFAPIAKLSNYDLFKHGVPVVCAFILFLYLQLNKNILKWSEEVITEIKKIVWPPLKDTRAMTVVVIIMVFISSLIISVFDLFPGSRLINSLNKGRLMSQTNENANANNEQPSEVQAMAKKWYIINVQTSCENTARNAIIERIKTNKLESYFGEILIPAENVVELVKGQKTTKSRKFFPGYIFVQMFLNDQTWHLVKNSSKVSGFVGGTKTRPPEVSEAEVMRVTQQMAGLSEKPRAKINFSLGEQVTVVDGPFNNFTGTVEEINEEKAKVKVLVSIFGRPTPVELDFVQIEKNS